MMDVPRGELAGGREIGKDSDFLIMVYGNSIRKFSHPVCSGSYKNMDEGHFMMKWNGN